MTYVEYDEEAFSYYAETYTFLTDSKKQVKIGQHLYTKMMTYNIFLTQI